MRKLAVVFLLCVVPSGSTAAYRLPSQYKNFRWTLNAAARSLYESNFQRVADANAQADLSAILDPRGEISYERRAFVIQSSLDYTWQRYLGLFNLAAQTRQTIETNSSVQLRTKAWQGTLTYNYIDTNEPQYPEETTRLLVKRWGYYGELQNVIQAASGRLAIRFGGKLGADGYLDSPRGVDLRKLNARYFSAKTSTEFQLTKRLNFGGRIVIFGRRPFNSAADIVDRSSNSISVEATGSFQISPRLSLSSGIGASGSRFAVNTNASTEISPLISAALRYARSDRYDVGVNYAYKLQQGTTSQFYRLSNFGFSGSYRLTRILGLTSTANYSYLKFETPNDGTADRTEHLVRANGGVFVVPVRLDQIKFQSQYVFERKFSNQPFDAITPVGSPQLAGPYKNHTAAFEVSWKY